MSNIAKDFILTDTFKKGKWIRFKGQSNAPRSYKKNNLKFQELIKDTSWAEKDEEKNPLENGDVFVLVDKNNKPLLEIKFSDWNICAIRSAEPDEYVNEEYEIIILSFFKGNLDRIRNIDNVMGSIDWNSKLQYYIKKIEECNFTKEDVPDFIRQYFLLNSRYMYNTELKPSYSNRNRSKLKTLLPNIKEQVAEYYNCSIDEILFDDLIVRTLPIKPGERYTIPYKVIFGYLDCSLSHPDCSIDLGNVERIAGDANFSFSSVTSLKNIREIAGNVVLSSSFVRDLGELSIVGGSMIVGKRSTLKSLQNVTRIGGNLDIYDSPVEDLGAIISIGGRFAPNNRITDLKNLEEIGGSASLNCATKLKSIGPNLKRILGDVYFPSSVEDLGALEYVGGKFDASYSSFKSLKHVKHVGTLYLWMGSVDDLGELEEIDGDAYLDSISNFGHLKRVKGRLACYDEETINKYNELLGINEDTIKKGK